METYKDFSKYRDQDLIAMLREKQKEYIILIQSEKIAKKMLNYYNKEFYNGEYHSRINNEYYLLYERATKKNLITQEDLKNEINVGIPIHSVIARLEESLDEVLKNNSQDYLSYKNIVTEITDELKKFFYTTDIVYKNGYLYFVTMDDEEVLITNESFDKFIENEGIVNKQKIKH